MFILFCFCQKSFFIQLTCNLFQLFLHMAAFTQPDQQGLEVSGLQICSPGAEIEIPDAVIKRLPYLIDLLQVMIVIVFGKWIGKSSASPDAEFQTIVFQQPGLIRSQICQSRLQKTKNSIIGKPFFHQAQCAHEETCQHIFCYR